MSEKIISNINLENNVINNINNKKKKNKNKSQILTPISSKTTQMRPIVKILLEKRRLQEEEDLRIKTLEDAEKMKILEETKKLEELKRILNEEKEKKSKAKQEKIQTQKNNGIYKTKSEKNKDKINKIKLEQMKNYNIITNINTFDNIINLEINKENNLEINKEIYRCPIFTILGHVDTGKTTLLDFLRKTTVQFNEVGGITQQIGTTLLTKKNILKQLEFINNKNIQNEIKIPGLLFIDTPGHEVFKGLRKLGTKIADVVIIIVDITHGLEPQTIESCKLLIETKTPFIFVFNKIDRLYGWNKKLNSTSIKDIIYSHDSNIINEFDTKFKFIRTQIMSLGINCELEWNNTSLNDTINIIPISAVTGQGIPDLLNWIVKYSQTILENQIIFNEDLDCIVMELSNNETLGYTLNCVIKNGNLSIGDMIKIQTQSGNFIITKIKNILTVQENKDSKNNTKYLSHNNIKGTNEIKIIALNLEKTQIGSKILLISNIDKEINNEIDIKINNEINNEIDNEIDKDINLYSETIKLDNKGIGIFSSTMGSLETIIQFLKSNDELINPIQISQISIGTVNKRDLIKLNIKNNNLDNLSENYIENLCVLAFEVKIDNDALQYANDNKITILKDETIYRLYTQYKNFATKIYNERKEKAR
jgi:translation initiation factor 5B